MKCLCFFCVLAVCFWCSADEKPMSYPQKLSYTLSLDETFEVIPKPGTDSVFVLKHQVYSLDSLV